MVNSQRDNASVNELEPRLSAYEAQARAIADSGPSRWPVYAAAVGSGLAMTTAAAAGIIYSGTQNTTASVAASPRGNSGRTSNQSKAINIDGIGGDEFNIKAFFQNNWAASTNRGSVGLLGGSVGSGQVIRNGSNAVKRLASGAVISNGAVGFGAGNFVHFKRLDTTGFGATAGTSTDLGTWASNQQGFAGVKFKQGGQDHFGWIQLKWQFDTAGFPFQVPNSITAIDWAYNDVAGESINAGQTTAVPEPGSLALLALGSVGVLAWRRRLKASA